MLNLLRVTPVIEGTEPTSLPEYYLVRVSTISCRLYSECRFRDTDSRSCVDYLGRSYFAREGTGALDRAIEAVVGTIGRFSGKDATRYFTSYGEEMFLFAISVKPSDTIKVESTIQIPKKYHHYADVFDKVQANTLS